MKFRNPSLLWAAPVAIAVAGALAPASASADRRVPDLSMLAVGKPPTAAAAGAEFRLSDTVKNIARVKARPSQTGYWLIRLRPGGRRVATGAKAVRIRVGTRQVPALHKGQRSRGTTTIRVPAETPTGAYRVVACTNAIGDRIHERGRRNNCSKARRSLRLGAPTAPSSAPSVLPTAAPTIPGAATPPTASSPPQAPSLPGNWTLKLNDEFTSVDPGRWVQKFWWNGDTYWPAEELQVYRPGNTTANGELSLTAQPASGLTNWKGSGTDSSGEPFAYTSGLVSSGGVRGSSAPGYQFTYGYAEARVWVPAGKGIFPAFWMLDSDYSDRSEIDIMETIGDDPATLQMHYHGPSGTYGATYKNPQPLSAGWHTYALDWQPGQLKWYLDGVERASLSRSDVPSNPHYVLLNLAVGGRNSWPGAPDSATPFPSTMKVDWFRVWQH